MLGQPSIQHIAERVLALVRQGQIELVISASDSALTRFANNTIHQNVAETNTHLTVRVAYGLKVGVAATNDLSDAGLARVVERASEMARLQPENPDFPGFAEPAPITPAGGYDEAAAAATPHLRAQAVSDICRRGQAAGVTTAGAFSTGVHEIAVANSRGVFGYHATTQCSLHAAASVDGGSGYAETASWRLDDIAAEPVGREAVDKALRGRNPQPLEPGRMPVILEPYAVHDLVGMLNYVGMGALSVQEGRSWMNDRIGQPVMSPSVTIEDDGHDEYGLPMPFDFEGVPKHKVAIVEKGVVLGPVYDLMTARREGRASTGHALPPPNIMGPLALNLIMAPGDATVQDMIRSTERGIYVTRFWYTRVVHPRDCVITGMTRDGVFLVEHGELSRPIKNLRFTQGYVPALAGVEMIGKDLHTALDDSSADRVPALKLSEFNFTGATQ